MLWMPPFQGLSLPYSRIPITKCLGQLSSTALLGLTGIIISLVFFKNFYPSFHHKP